MSTIRRRKIDITDGRIDKMKGSYEDIGSL